MASLSKLFIVKKALFSLLLLLIVSYFTGLTGGELQALAQVDSDTDSENWQWPDEDDSRNYTSTPSYFTPSSNPLVKDFQTAEQEAQKASGQMDPVSQAQAAAQQKKPKDKLAIFKRTKKVKVNGKKVKPLTDEQITRVGPRETQPMKDPLLALSMPLQPEAQPVIESGFYLLRLAPSAEGASGKTLMLIKQSKVVAQIPVFLAGSENSPLSSSRTFPNSNTPTPLAGSASIRFSPVSADQSQTAILILKDQGQVYQSAPIPVLGDTRKELAY